MSAPGEPRPLHGGRLAITALALAAGTFMQVLDSTIANVSLPTIAGNLGVSVNQGRQSSRSPIHGKGRVRWNRHQIAGTMSIANG